MSPSVSVCNPWTSKRKRQPPCNFKLKLKFKHHCLKGLKSGGFSHMHRFKTFFRYTEPTVPSLTDENKNRDSTPKPHHTTRYTKPIHLAVTSHRESTTRQGVTPQPTNQPDQATNQATKKNIYRAPFLTRYQVHTVALQQRQRHLHVLLQGSGGGGGGARRHKEPQPFCLKQ